MRKIFFKTMGILSLFILLYAIVIYFNKGLNFETTSKIKYLEYSKEVMSECKSCKDFLGIKLNYTFQGKPLDDQSPLGLTVDFGYGVILNSNNYVFRDSSLTVINHSSITDFDLDVILPDIETNFGNFPLINNYEFDLDCRYRLTLRYNGYDPLMRIQGFDVLGKVDLNIKVEIIGYMSTLESENVIREVIMDECLKKISSQLTGLLKDS